MSNAVRCCSFFYSGGLEPQGGFCVKKTVRWTVFSKKVRSPVPKGKAFGWTSRQDAVGGCILSPAPRRSKVRFASIFYVKKSSARFLASPFRKKSRSACLFSCKRPHVATLSLPTFCEFYFETLLTSTPKMSNAVRCCSFFIREDLNLKEVFALRKQSGGLFFSLIFFVSSL